MGEDGERAAVAAGGGFPQAVIVENLEQLFLKSAPRLDLPPKFCQYRYISVELNAVGPDDFVPAAGVGFDQGARFRWRGA